MFEINLLPKELRKKRLVLPQANIIQISCGVLGLFVILHIGLGLVVALKRHSLNRLTTAYNKLLPEKKTVDLIKFELKNLNEKAKLANQISSNRIIWAQILNSLSDILPTNLWLTQLSYQPDKSAITIRGMALERDSDAMASIGQFIQGWKAYRIEVESVNKKDLKGVEVLEFKLNCYPK